jgi:sporulation protein YlmC with PRC-barrel domain
MYFWVIGLLIGSHKLPDRALHIFSGMVRASVKNDTITIPTTTPAAGGDAAMADATTGWSVKNNIMGKAVYNENDEKVGDISDIILSADGKTNYFVVGVGGFIGMGERRVAIPFDKFTHTEDRISVQGYTKEQLKEMPEFQLAK